MRYTIIVLALQFTLGAGFGGTAVWLAMRRRRKKVEPPRVDEW